MDPTQTTLVRSGTATLLVDTNNKKVLTYLRNGGTIQLDLGQFQGSLNGERYNPREGTIDRSTTISGGSVLSFTPPSQTSSDWVLYITPSTQQRCSDNTPYNQCSSNKPLYCSNGNLVSRCGSPQTCGCPALLTCQPDGSCQAPPSTIVIPDQADWRDGGTVLSKGVQGSWDYRMEGALSPATVIKKGSTYYLYYIAASGSRSCPPHCDNGPANRSLGVATSTDGIRFTKYSGNPIIRYQPNGNEEEGLFSAGSTLDVNGDILLYYSACNAGSRFSTSVTCDGYVARSSNGLNFGAQSTHTRVLSHSNSNLWGYGDEIFPIGAFYANSNYYVYYITKNGGSISWDLGVAWGTSFNNLGQSSSVITSETEIRGGGDPIKIDANNYAMFLVRDPNNFVTEARKFSSTNFRTLGTPVEIYDMNDVIVNTILYDTSTSTWFMYYLNGDVPVGTRIGVKTARQSTQQCSDNTPYNQCSSTKPLYCLSNGTLIPSCGSPYICGCPANLPTCITQIGMCVISENFPPTATITLPTQTSFIINTQINYNGQGSDPENQPLTYTWTYDIIGDTSPEFPLPPGQSGTFTPTILVRNQSTLYTLKLVVRDTQGATGTAMKNLTINPGTTQSCQQQNGICCTSGQICNGNSVASNNCNTLCCVGTCQTPSGGQLTGIPLSGFWQNWYARHGMGIGSGGKFDNGPNNAYGRMSYNTLAITRLDVDGRGVGRKGWLEFDYRIEGPRPMDCKGGGHLLSVTSQSSCVGPCDPSTGQNLNGWLRIDHGVCEDQLGEAIYNINGDGTGFRVTNANKQSLISWRQWVPVRVEWEQTTNNLRVKLNNRESNVAISPTSRDTGILLVVGNTDRYIGHPAPGYEEICHDDLSRCICLDSSGVQLPRSHIDAYGCRCTADKDPCGMIGEVWYRNFRW